MSGRYLMILFLLMATSMMASATPNSWHTNADGVVLDGYDVVAYHTQDRAVQGQAKFGATHDGVTFYFSSAANRDLFHADPALYAPAYHGYCAFGVATNKAKVSADPRTFKIYNGQLLVFFNDLYQGQAVNTKIMWNANEQPLHEVAVTSWTSLE